MDRKAMIFGSVCSGIEAASVAWHPLGWQAAWFAEIEPFPCAVLAHHYPAVPNLGDMTKLPDLIRSGAVEVPDILCGGTPCQAFSVAGLRQSLSDERGNLSLTFCEIADAIDEHRPSIIFWENVPGVLNTKDNAFGCFLAGLAGEDEALVPPGGRWTNAGFVDGPKRAVAWRVLDAQYFGVAQRRRRVFVVASARADFDPAAVLFEFEGVRRDPAPSREKRQVAPTIPSRSTAGGGLGTDFDCDGGVVKVCPTIGTGAPFSRTGNDRVEADALIPQPYEVGNTLTARMHKGVNSTLDEGQTPLVSIAFHSTQDPISSTEVRRAIGTGNGQGCATAAVCFDDLRRFNGPHGGFEHGDIHPTLESTNPKQIALTALQVRRLTPVECERLQGFPDGYTNIPWRGKPESPDGPRYKALGNSWAVPVVRWIGERISRAT